MPLISDMILDDLESVLSERREKQDTDIIANVAIFREHKTDGIQVLITKNHKSDDLWALPGGRLDLHETAEEAALREIEEETHIKLKKLTLLTKQEKNVLRGKTVFTFFAIVPPNTDATAGDDVREVKWKAIAKIKPMKFGDHLLVQSAVLKAFDTEFVLRSLLQGIQDHLTEEVQPTSLLTRSRPKVKQGKLIVFEGIDGSGKSTAVDQLEDWLRIRGHDVVRTKWASSPLLNKAIKQAKNELDLSPMMYSLLHAADLIYRYEHVIVPALQANKVVIADRYCYTSYVRDQLRGVGMDLLLKLFEDFRAPDLLIHCVVPPRIAFERLQAGKGALKHYASGADIGYPGNPKEAAIAYAGDMDRLYQQILPGQPNYLRVAADRPVLKVFSDILSAVETRLLPK